MGRSHRIDVKVRWGEADPMGIVFYPTYLAWFDHATHELFASSGRSLTTWLEQEGTSVPIAECGARFRAPVFAGDELVVTATAAEVSARSFRVEHAVERDGELVATGFEVRVVARMGDGGRLEVSPLPDELRAWLEDGPAETGGDPAQ